MKLFYFVLGILAFVNLPAESGRTLSPIVLEAPKNELSLTKQFLQDYSLEEIQSYFLWEEGIDIVPFLPLFYEAIEQEKPGFFGYHATTLKHWVLQEIVKQTLIITRNMKVRDNFYFLRSPIHHDETIQNIESFLSKCLEARDLATLEEKRQFISSGFLKMIEKEGYLYEDESAHQVFEAILFFSPMSSEILQEEAENRLIHFVGYEDYENWLCKRCQEEFCLPFFSALNEEEFALYYNIYFPVLDTRPWQQKLLVSLNISLFGNFTTPNESTVRVFIKGRSVDPKADEILERAAKQFLESYGFPEYLGKEIFQGAQKITSLQQGILLQFFDDPNYSHIDSFSFICRGCNSPYREKTPAAYISQFDITEKTEQIRFLVTEETLDPHSNWLQIKQYDLIPFEKKEAIRNMIREKIKAHS